MLEDAGDGGRLRVAWVSLLTIVYVKITQKCELGCRVCEYVSATRRSLAAIAERENEAPQKLQRRSRITARGMEGVRCVQSGTQSIALCP